MSGLKNAIIALKMVNKNNKFIKQLESTFGLVKTNLRALTYFTLTLKKKIMYNYTESLRSFIEIFKEINIIKKYKYLIK